MWNQHSRQGSSCHQLGKVTGQNRGVILVQSDNEYKALQMAAPYGITWLPPKAAVAVVLSSDTGEGQNDVCIGTRMKAASIAPGELLLRSAGGAEIYLKNSGEVVINGQVFPKQEG